MRKLLITGFEAFGGELGNNACDVAEEDQAKEGKALALGGAGAPGFQYIKRPGGPEAYDHDNFQNFRHKNAPFGKN